MTNDEQNKRLAELLEMNPHPSAFCESGIGHFERGICIREIPNYCADLNAVHEAVMGLLDSDRDIYRLELCRSIRPTTTGPESAMQLAMDATAAQRVDALIRTLESNHNKDDAPLPRDKGTP